MARHEGSVDPPTQARPNLLILYADQWRGSALGCAGDPVVRTPALDGLAAQGVRVPHAYTVNPVCTPSRSSLLTARYPHATGVIGNNRRLPEGEVGFAQVLAASGYRTGYVGKWHLDGEEKPGFVPPGARRHGFTYWAAFNRGHEYYAPVYYRDADSAITSEAYEPDLQTDLALSFLQDPDPRPFCLLLAWGPPHTPLLPPPHTAGLYRPEDMPLAPSVPAAEAARARRERAAYCGLITSLDRDVGRLLQWLAGSGRERNTIVCFTADHGDLIGEHGLYRKGRPEEESIHVPLVIRWPGRVPAGMRADLLVASVDVAPTLLGLAGLRMPVGVHGHDLGGALVGERLGGAPPRAVYIEGRMGTAEEWRAVRTRDHLLAVNRAGEPTHLYDMRQDPWQLRNLVDEPRAGPLAADLLVRLRDLARETGDPLWPSEAPVATPP